jgi:hypothetical protein
MAPVMVIQWIGAALLAIFGTKISANMLGFDLAVGRPAGTAPQTGAGVYPDTGAPSAGAITKDFVNQPLSIWGIAAIGFVAVFVIAQLRAAGKDAVSTLNDSTKALSNPDVRAK